MANEEQLNILRQGVTVWNTWRLNFRIMRVDLSGADLRDIPLGGAVLSHANLEKADLRNVDLRGAKLNNSDLTRADLRGANLSEADLY